MIHAIRNHFQRKRRTKDREKLLATVRSLGYEIVCSNAEATPADPQSQPPYFVLLPSGEKVAGKDGAGFAKLSEAWDAVIGHQQSLRK
jgi:hypothetical protein